MLDQSWGLIDPAGMEPVRPETRFDLASVSKLFTVTAFLQQVAAGKVSLDDPVVSLVPELAGEGPRPIAGGQDPHTLVRLANRWAIRRSVSIRPRSPSVTC